jgi:hypothetical protein
LNQGGLEPGGAFSSSVGASFAGAFVESWTQASPGDEISCSWKTGHVVTDFGDDYPSRDVADSGNGRQEVDGGAKGTLVGPHLQLADRPF